MLLSYVHYLRAIAILFIVGGHTIDAFSWSSVQIEKLMRIVISYDGSVLFVFISGYLFQHLSPKFEFKKFYSRKFKNVIVPYLLVSIPAIAMSVTVVSQQDVVWPGFYDDPIYVQIINFYLTGFHLAPLWFIPTIIIFFACAPLLIIADKSKYFYYLLPAFIVISCITTRGLPLLNFVHFFSAYMLGMFFSKHKAFINPIASQPKIINTTLAVVVALVAVDFALSADTSTYLSYLQKLAMAVLFLGLLVRYTTAHVPPYIAMLADYSFGIYFTHSYFLSGGKLVYENLTGSLASGSLGVFALISLLVMLLCCISIWIIKRLFHMHSRILIGS